MDRRQFIQSTASATLLALGGVSAFQFYQQNQISYNRKIDYIFLNSDDDILFDVLIPLYLFGTRENQLDIKPSLQDIKINIDSAISLLSISAQKELRELLDWLSTGFGRLVIGGVWLNWQLATDESVNQFISDWRESSIELLQIGYKGLHKIIIGSSYAEDVLWGSIGYPGPPQIHSSPL